MIDASKVIADLEAAKEAIATKCCESSYDMPNREQILTTLDEVMAMVNHIIAMEPPTLDECPALLNSFGYCGFKDWEIREGQGAASGLRFLVGVFDTVGFTEWEARILGANVRSILEGRGNGPKH